jgi:hypothetical protein
VEKPDKIGVDNEMDEFNEKRISDIVRVGFKKNPRVSSKGVLSL